jgi:activator of 2-hydroxyglutaryl-CoA dehydratase
VVEALARQIGHPIRVTAHAQINGALGAALLAAG